MVDKVRKKFIVITMSIIAAITVVIGSVFFGYTLISLRREAYMSLDKLQKNAVRTSLSGDMPHGQTEYFRSFTVVYSSLSESGEITYDQSLFTTDEIKEKTASILNSDKQQGRLGTLYYSVTADNSYTIIAATDKSIELNTFKEWFLSGLIIELTFLLILYFIIYRLSFWVVRPVQEALARQKRFISDARHELKTPITVIDANADVLALKLGENEWVDNIISQVDRMNYLANDMLQLAEMEKPATAEKSAFNLSKSIMNSALPFESLAFEKGNVIEYDIKEDIMYTGDENAVKQAITILIDNALKYSTDKTAIKVSLKLLAHNKPCAEVFNLSNSVDPAEREKLFERFYRGDSSRARETGGNGLGLSILKDIADKNGWKLNADIVKNTSIKFSIIFL